MSSCLESLSKHYSSHFAVCKFSFLLWTTFSLGPSWIKGPKLQMQMFTQTVTTSQWWLFWLLQSNSQMSGVLLFLYICVFSVMGKIMNTPQHVCLSQRTTFRTPFYSSTVYSGNWTKVIKLLWEKSVSRVLFDCLLACLLCPSFIPSFLACFLLFFLISLLAYWDRISFYSLVWLRIYHTL